MKIHLKDIIDLDYLISIDEDLYSKEEIKDRELKDRKIYSQCRKTAETDRDLLFSWLAFRKKEKKTPLLPGNIFSRILTCMTYLMILSGLIIGITTAYTFLAYHGTTPVNVTGFTVIFIFLPAVLFLSALFWNVYRKLTHNRTSGERFIYKSVSCLAFNVVPEVIKRAGRAVSHRNPENIDYLVSFVRIKIQEYNQLFFWPFSILTSLFAFSFSTGALGGTFLKIVISDMAFGWQSTLITSGKSVHDIVSLMALPWSWVIPGFSAPTLEQIEGSRIILKHGIHALATQDLASWWPFLCAGILFYAVIPRGIIMITGYFLQQQVINNLDFTTPKFRQVIARMKSPVINIDAREIPLNRGKNRVPPKDEKIKSSLVQKRKTMSGKTLLLFSDNVYSREQVEKIIKGVEHNLLLDVQEVMDISLEWENDEAKVARAGEFLTDQVIIVHEVWQPPIRELLLYLSQLKSAVHEKTPLYILLTGDAGEDALGVEKKDINFKVWKDAVLRLEDKTISTIRFWQS